MSAEPISQAHPAKLWEAPDHSVTIHLAFEAIDAINEALAQIAEKPPIHGAEVGGLLLGRSERLGKITVWIDGFEALPCSYPRGPSWMLADGEQEGFAEKLAEPRAVHIVGFFRSHTRKGLFLNLEDVALFSRFFPESTNVFLLVKPFTTRPSLGGFFYWENESIHGDASYREFPFLRNEPNSAPSPHEPAILQNEPNRIPKREPFVRGPEAERTKRTAPIVWMSLLLGLVTLGVVGLAAYSIYGQRGRVGIPPRAAPPEGTVRLTAAEGEKSVALTWDRTSPIIVAASHGSVAIGEGSFHKTVELGPEELREGRLVYSRPIPISDTISFRMQLDTGQGEPFTEAVRLVSRPAVGTPPEPAKAVLPEKTRPTARVLPRTMPRPQIAAPPPAIPDVTPAAVVLPTPPAEVPKPAPPRIVRPAPRREP